MAPTNFHANDKINGVWVSSIKTKGSCQKKSCDIVLIRGKFIFGDLPFCKFVRNKIYEFEIEMLEPPVLAKDLPRCDPTK